MKDPCEVCFDHEKVRPQHEYRVVRTELGDMGLKLCGPHSSALTRSIAAHARAAHAIPRHFMIHEDEHGNRSAHDVQ